MKLFRVQRTILAGKKESRRDGIFIGMDEVHGALAGFLPGGAKIMTKQSDDLSFEKNEVKSLGKEKGRGEKEMF